MEISFRRPRRIYLARLFIASLITTFLYFYFYPESPKKVLTVFGVIIFGSPVLTLLTCLIFPFCKKPGALIFAKIEAALYAALVFIALATFQDDGSLGALFASAYLFVMTIILIIMMIVMGIKNYAYRKKPINLAAHWLFRDILFSTLGGWLTGILIWSLTTPAMIIAAAEKMAASAPYCINAHNGPARSLIDLTALRFYSLSYRWLDAGDRHGTLTVVIKADDYHQNKANVTYRHFFYWSYRLKSFVPYGYYISDGETSGACIPAKDFAKKLPVLPFLM